jgi:hypothetical protein
MTAVFTTKATFIPGRMPRMSSSPNSTAKISAGRPTGACQPSKNCPRWFMRIPGYLRSIRLISRKHCCPVLGRLLPMPSVRTSRGSCPSSSAASTASISRVALACVPCAADSDWIFDNLGLWGDTGHDGRQCACGQVGMNNDSLRTFAEFNQMARVTNHHCLPAIAFRYFSRIRRHSHKRTASS